MSQEYMELRFADAASFPCQEHGRSQEARWSFAFRIPGVVGPDVVQRNTICTPYAWRFRFLFVAQADLMYSAGVKKVFGYALYSCRSFACKSIGRDY
jgi:hypothetical protein